MLLKRFLVIVLGVGTALQYVDAEVLTKEVKEVRSFIKKNWAGSIEYNPQDQGSVFGLPHPYNVPTVAGASAFKEMYYWDTYFTNVGLIYDDFQQAKNNTENIQFMVERFGKMLNGSNRCYLNRSQPPYFSMMVADIYAHQQDTAWLRKMVLSLEKEYRFWMTERITPCGLNRYSSAASDQEKIDMAHAVASRLGDATLVQNTSREEMIKRGSHYVAEAESGWDFNPRFDSRCEDFCPVDLNSNLYLYEKNFAYFYQCLGENASAKKWNVIAEKRKKRMNQFCYDSQRGIYLDYDFVNGKRSTVVSAASFHPLYAQLASKSAAKKTVQEVLPLIERGYGVQCCEHKDYKHVYQWAEINGWAPLQYIVVVGLKNYHYTAEATRVAHKFLGTVARNYQSTDNLWEKYNVVDGSIYAKNEYEMPPFLGWTAGVFIYFDVHFSMKK